MIPNTNGLGEGRESRSLTRDFYLDKDSKRISGLTQGQGATYQAAWLILHTKRFWHEIYSFDYGVQLDNLAALDDGFLFPEIKRRIREALLVDERLEDVSDFEFSRNGRRVSVRFLLHTVYDGEMQMEYVI